MQGEDCLYLIREEELGPSLESGCCLVEESAKVVTFSFEWHWGYPASANLCNFASGRVEGPNPVHHGGASRELVLLLSLTYS